MELFGCMIFMILLIPVFLVMGIGYFAYLVLGSLVIKPGSKPESQPEVVEVPQANHQ